MANAIHPDSHITLHYRLSTIDGVDVLNTFLYTPATLALGQGLLAAPLEDYLIGLKAGDKHSFTIPAGTLFGTYNPDLRYFISRVALQHIVSARDAPITVGDVININVPKSTEQLTVSAQVSVVTDTGYWLDLNHPLANKSLIFTVEIIAVL